ncbi:MAG: hypothetical protein RIC19_14555 [Phaeodactylibacter sp.]|uniref:hypothetical protein n=1 Tax=Phaeodactylibacter sp. TaxID=1940289 RepID=UPI0032F0445C
MPYQYLNLDYLELMAGDDANDRHRLLEMLKKDLNAYPTLMQRTFEAKEWAKLERQAHYFKSTLPFTGYKKLIEIHRSVYEQVKEKGSRSEIALLLEQVLQHCKIVLEEVQKELDKG